VKGCVGFAPSWVAIYVLTSIKTFPENLRDCASAKDVLSFDDLAAWVTLPSVVLWQHIHTKYVRVPQRIGSEMVLRASLEDLDTYREFVRLRKSLSSHRPLIDPSPSAPPATNSKPSRL